MEQAYVISQASKEDITKLLKSLGNVRALLPVQVAPDEEEILKASIWSVAGLLHLCCNCVGPRHLLFQKIEQISDELSYLEQGSSRQQGLLPAPRPYASPWYPRNRDAADGEHPEQGPTANCCHC